MAKADSRTFGLSGPLAILVLVAVLTNPVERRESLPGPPSTSEAQPTEASRALERRPSYRLRGVRRIDGSDQEPELVIDGWTGRIFASGSAGGRDVTLVIDSRSADLVDTLDVEGLLALDARRHRLYVDERDHVSLFDTRTLKRIQRIQVPRRDAQERDEHVWGIPEIAPMADARTGHLWLVRDRRVLEYEPIEGRLIREIRNPIPGSSNDLRYAHMEPETGLMYLAAFDLAASAYMHEIDLIGLDPSNDEVFLEISTSDFLSALLTWDEHLLVADTWGRGWFTFLGLWRRGEPLSRITYWPRLPDRTRRVVHDSTRDRLIVQFGDDDRYLAVLDPESLELRHFADGPLDGDLVGFDPISDRLYFILEGRLQALAASSVREMVDDQGLTNPVWHRISLPIFAPGLTLGAERFAYARRSPRKDCSGERFSNTLVRSLTVGRTWRDAQGGLPHCLRPDSLSFSPNYRQDRTIFASVEQHGLIRTTDGGEHWRVVNDGLQSMTVRGIDVSPDYANDRTVFAITATGTKKDTTYRSSDGGWTWQEVGSFRDLAFAPEFSTSKEMYAIGELSTDIYRSTDSGQRWSNVGSIPASGAADDLLVLSSDAGTQPVVLAIVLDQHGTMMQVDPISGRRVWRSDDGGRRWSPVLEDVDDDLISGLFQLEGGAVLTTGLRYARGRQTHSRSTLYSSDDLGMTWARVHHPVFDERGAFAQPTGDGRIIVSWYLESAEQSQYRVLSASELRPFVPGVVDPPAYRVVDSFGLAD